MKKSEFDGVIIDGVDLGKSNMSYDDKRRLVDFHDVLSRKREMHDVEINSSNPTLRMAQYHAKKLYEIRMRRK